MSACACARAPAEPLFLRTVMHDVVRTLRAADDNAVCVCVCVAFHGLVRAVGLCSLCDLLLPAQLPSLLTTA